MSERVWMVHPNLPDQRIHVRPGGVGVYQASGWRVETEADARAARREQLEAARDLLTAAGWTVTPPAEPEAADEADTQPEPRRGRRAKTEGE